VTRARHSTPIYDHTGVKPNVSRITRPGCPTNKTNSPPGNEDGRHRRNGCAASTVSGCVDCLRTYRHYNTYMCKSVYAGWRALRAGRCRRSVFTAAADCHRGCEAAQCVRRLEGRSTARINRFISRMQYIVVRVPGSSAPSCVRSLSRRAWRRGGSGHRPRDQRMPVRTGPRRDRMLCIDRVAVLTTGANSASGLFESQARLSRRPTHMLHPARSRGARIDQGLDGFRLV